MEDVASLPRIGLVYTTIRPPTEITSPHGPRPILSHRVTIHRAIYTYKRIFQETVDMTHFVVSDRGYCLENQPTLQITGIRKGHNRTHSNSGLPIAGVAGGESEIH